MRYYTSVPKFNRKERKAGVEKEFNSKLTSLDRTILKKASQPRGEDRLGIMNACRPYINKNGAKQFASFVEIISAISKLVKSGLLLEK